MAEQSDGGLRAHAEDGVLLLRLDRSAKRNAVDQPLADALDRELARLEDDPQLSVAVLTGDERCFSAGTDMTLGASPATPEGGAYGLVRRTRSKPVIAAVEGYALGGGFEIVLACDLVVASREATFGLPETKRGLTAAAGGLLRLQHRVPYHLAMELILTGRMWPATEAADVHLVNRLAEPGAALETALALADEVAANAPLALAASKQVLVQSVDWPLAEKFDRQEAFVDPIRQSADAQEGARAFVEKRVPEWTGC